MKLLEVKNLLPNLENVEFKLENGTFVPEHFHVTEIGLVNKTFIDCGGTLRTDSKVVFQLWDADDYEHRLKPSKLVHIIQLAQEKLGIADSQEIEVEYQLDTLGKYALLFNHPHFILKAKASACLAGESCGLPQSETSTSPSSSCSPEAGCC